jgi:hypothetical protein
MYKINNFIADLEELIVLVKGEIYDRINGIHGDGTLIQLTKYVLPELEELLKFAKEGNIPCSNNRWVVSSWSIIHEWLPDWDWNNPSVMMIKINQLDEKYRNELKYPEA